MVSNNVFTRNIERVEDKTLSSSKGEKKIAMTSTVLQPAPPGIHVRRKKKKQHVHVEMSIHPMCPSTTSLLHQNWNNFFSKRQNGRQKERSYNQIQKIISDEVPEDLSKSCKSFTVELLDDGYCTANNDNSIDNNNNSSTSSSSLENKAGYGIETIIHVHPYILSEEEPTIEELEPTNDGGDVTVGCDNIQLPNKIFDGLWESLIIPKDIKCHLLEYAMSGLYFSDKGVSSNIIGWNRLILLHGPPGTGKTSLCKALSQKLSIRLGHRFTSGATLLEIHSHSLFSKWFSTSGKLVNKLFDLVKDICHDDPNMLVCVLIDEVESLASSRSDLSSNSGEPSDSMRAVNSLLTSLDKLKSLPNVLILATTNITNSVDVAFVDRADIKQYIGLPMLQARYEILRSCLTELIRVGIIIDNQEEVTTSRNSLFSTQSSLSSSSSSSPLALLSFRECQRVLLSISSSNSNDIIASKDNNDHQQNINPKSTLHLLHSCAELSDGLSGRSLRKIPFQCHAQFICKTNPVTLDEFLHALEKTIKKEHESRRKLNDL